MSSWWWLGFALPLQWLTPSKKVGRGRILTRWMHKLLLPRISANGFRSLQVFTLIAVVAITPVLGLLPSGGGNFWDPLNVAYFLPLVALYLDDWLTGDDDDWKHFWDTVRNKIRWKMELPQPQESQ